MSLETRINTAVLSAATYLGSLCIPEVVEMNRVGGVLRVCFTVHYHDDDMSTQWGSWCEGDLLLDGID